MSSDDIKKSKKGFSEKEEKMLKKVLNNYDFKVKDYTKVRSVYKIKTDQGNICIKGTEHGSRKIKNGFILVEELNNVGFDNTADYIKTKHGNRLVKYKDFRFYATKWIDGNECDLSNLDEAANCAKFLAEFHNATDKIDIKKLNVKNNLKNWPEIFNSNLSDLDRFKKIIERKKIKTEFDNNYLNYIDSFINRGIISMRLLNQSNYYQLSKDANLKKTLCHDSYYYQNIIKKDDKYYLIDLDSIIIDIHINDLGKYIRRLMYKKEYSWDFEKAKVLIESYSSKKPLSKDELEVMLALIVFPHKFWKLGKKRYIKHNNWSETKYSRKLNRLARYNYEQQKFMENYIKYLIDL